MLIPSWLSSKKYVFAGSLLPQIRDQVWNITKTTPNVVTNELHTVDGRNPGNQLRLVVYPTIYRVLKKSRSWRRISSINSTLKKMNTSFLNEYIWRI